MSGKSRCIRLLSIILIGLPFQTGMVSLPTASAQAYMQGQPVSPEDIKRLQAEQMARMRAKNPSAGNPQPEKPSKDAKKDDKKKKDESKEEKEDDSKLVKRPTEPDKPADPEELKVKPDKTGRVQFSFRGQAWVDVLQWFADVASYSFDWQELPGDFLNLTTQRKYTLPETRDLLNRHLLARGFTLIVQGEILTAVKISKLDPSLIPRAEADDLEDYAPHDFFKVTFSLPHSMEPAKAAEDVKILLSPNAKVTPLLASKRLLVIDAVANLRDVRNLLYAEQMVVDQIIKPYERRLKHRRADFVADQIMVVLGLDPAARKTPQELQIEQQKMQMMTKMQQKGKDVSKLLQKDGPKVFIAVNLRQNSILVNAPPDLMPTIVRTIDLFDRPDGAGEAISSGPLSMKTYKTVTASPVEVIKSLQEIGSLDPMTQLRSDLSSKSIYAYATTADHAKIDSMIDKLDGTGRRAEVIWLRRLAADQVAGTIVALLVGEEKKEEPRQSFWSYRRSNDEKKEVGFKAIADVESNRLLLWANDAELEEVNKLLVQLGEIPSDESRNPNTVRVIPSHDPETTAGLLRQLEQTWSGKNRLQIHTPPAGTQDKKPEQKEKTPVKPVAKEDTLTQHRVQRLELPASRLGLAQFAGYETASDEKKSRPEQAPRSSGKTESSPAAADANPDAKAASPIDIFVTKDGRIVLRSDDPAALDELEDLLGELSPPQDEFQIFHLHNASAYWVVDYLEQYFEDELLGGTEARFNIWGDYRGQKKKKPGAATLSKRRLLRFIHDVDTNTILVQNTSPTQLRIIKQLIKVYDQPMSEDAVSTRHTEAIKIKYSRAADIATSLKEAYRDLLSSKDKEFQGKEKGEKSRNETSYRFSYGPPEDEKKSKKPDAVKIAFEGALSVGVDEISNSIIISAQEEVWESVRQIVLQLDEAAKPNTIIHVHEVSRLVPTSTLQKALASALGEPWPGGKPPKGKSSKGGKGAGKDEGDDAKDGGANKK